jgi:hypothetical protein
VHTLLDGSRRNGLQVVQVLTRSGLGVVGALLILKAVLLLTSTGVGVIATLIAWLYGLPTTQILALAGTGVLMCVLSAIPFRDNRVLNTCTATLERLMRKKLREARNKNTPEQDLS